MTQPQKFKLTENQEDIWMVKKLSTSCFIKKDNQKNNFLNKYKEKQAKAEKSLVANLFEEKEICSERKAKKIMELAESWRYKYEAAKKVFFTKLEVKDAEGILAIIKEQKAEASMLWKTLINVEKEHSQCIREILRKCNERLTKHSVESPCKIQYFLEYEILRYNQMTLHNQRVLAQLHREIQLQIANWWLQYSYICTPPEESITSMQDILERTSDQFQEEYEGDISIKQLIKFMIENMKRLNHYYRDLIEKLFFSNDDHYVIELINFQELSDLRISIDTMFNLLVYLDKTQSESWKVMIEDLSGHINFITETWELVKKYQDRLNQIYSEIYNVLKQVQIDFSQIQNKSEQNISQALDVMRRQSSISSLVVSWERIVELLKNGVKFYKEAYLAEQNSAEYLIQNLLEKIRDYIWAEIAQLIYKYNLQRSPDTIIPSDVSLLEFDPCGEEELETDEDMNYLIEVKEEYDIKMNLNCLYNWKLGLLEALKMFGLTTKKRIPKLTEIWEQKLKSISSDNYHFKRSMHEPRQIRIREEVYNTRLAELRIHSHRFERHQSAVMQILERIENAYYELEENERTCIIELEDPIKQIEEFAFKECTILKIRAALKRLDDLLESQKESLICAIESLRSEATASLEWIQRSSAAFVKALRLFSEGGNFSSEEATSLSIKIDRLTDKVLERSQAFNTQINKFQSEGLTKLEDRVKASRNRVEFIIEEFVVNNNLIVTKNRAQNEVKSVNQRVTQALQDISSRVQEIDNKSFCELLKKSQELLVLIKKDGEAYELLDKIVCRGSEKSIKYIMEFYQKRSNRGILRVDILPNTEKDCVSFVQNGFNQLYNEYEEHLDLLFIDFNDKMKEFLEKMENFAENWLNDLHECRIRRLNKKYEEWSEKLLSKIPKKSAPLLHSHLGFPGNNDQLVHHQDMAHKFAEEVQEYLKNAAKDLKMIMDKEAKIYAQEHPSMVQGINTMLEDISKLITNGNENAVRNLDFLTMESENKIKEFTKIYLQNIELGGEKIQEIHKDLQSWIFTWSMDVENIKQLYMLKYE